MESPLEPFNGEERKKHEEEKERKDFLMKAMFSELSQEEIDRIADIVKSKTFKDDPELIFCIEVLGLAQSVQYRDLVEKYLYYPQNPQVVISALDMLCDHYHFSSENLDQLKKFIKRMSWDKTGDIQFHATYCAGKYLKDHFDRELLEMLLLTFVDKERDLPLRAEAYRALELAAGEKKYEIPSRDEVEEALRSGGVNKFYVINPSFIDKAKMRLI